MHLVYLMNVYGPGLSILFVVFVEAAGVCWLYGTDNFSRDIEKMLGHRPGIFWRVCWKYISPFFLLVRANANSCPVDSFLRNCDSRRFLYSRC